MKLMIASDIHGSALYCTKMIDAFFRENADNLVLLGDFLYHGPRNDLPDGYDPKAVIKLLNPLADRLFCVRGNCDSEVDQMVLSFPMMADYALLAAGTHTVFVTHGHLFHPEHLPPLKSGDVLLNGHTHVMAWENRGEYLYFNPGSISIPKNGSARGYILMNDTVFTWKMLDGTEIKKIILP